MKTFILIFALVLSSFSLSAQTLNCPPPEFCNDGLVACYGHFCTLSSDTVKFGVIYSGSWQGTPVGTTKGGTGLTSVGSSGQMPYSTGTAWAWMTPTFYKPSDTTATLMTRYAANAAIATMTSGINSKLAITDTTGKWMGLTRTYTKPQSDARFILTSDSSLYLRKTGAASLYQAKGSYLTTASALAPANITQTASYRLVTDTEKTTWNSKFTSPTGTTAQYIKGDGSLATFPTIYSFTGLSSQYTKGDGTYGTLPSSSSPTYGYVTRTPATSPTSYTPSTTQPYRVYYTIEISCTASIGSTSDGSVILQYFNGTSWVSSSAQIRNSNTVTLAVALNSVTVQKSTISEEFPANTQLRLLSSTTGTTSITYVTGKEVLY